MKQRFYWTEEKALELKNLWGTMALYKLAEHFHTIPETIEGKAHELGLPVYKSNRWTKDEEKLLAEYSKNCYTQDIANKLGRSYIAVQKKALKLGIELRSEPDPWDEDKIEYLKKNINKTPIGKIEEKLGISYRRILTKCKDLGIEYVSENWTEEEINTLREYAPKCHYTELVKVLPNRTIGAISAKAFELGIQTISEYHKLSEKDEKYIRKNWGKKPATEIARHLHITTGILYRYKRQLGLPNVGQQKKWTEKRIKQLREDAKTMNRSQLAKKYKTSASQISTISRKHGIKLINSRNIWNKERDAELLALVEKDLSIAEISQKMEIKANNIRTHLKALGITKYASTKQRAAKWSKEEIDTLKAMSDTATVSEIATKVNRTERQVISKAKKLGITVNTDSQFVWTEQDTVVLTNLSDAYDRHMIAQVMNKSEEFIKQKAEELGLTLTIRERKQWTTDEVKKLEAYTKEFTIREIAFLLGRSIASVGSKLRYMGLSAQSSSRFWTEKECETLKQLAATHSIEEIAVEMHKSYEAITAKLYQLGIRAVIKSSRPWTADEEARLVELLNNYSSFEVAEKLDRTEASIIVRALKLGYVVDAKHRRWTEDEEQKLQDMWGNYPVEVIASELNRTVFAIHNRVYLLGLGAFSENNYKGLTLKDISDLFNVDINTVSVGWVSLGLRYKIQQISEVSSYRYVEINDLYSFLEANQNIWDSRCLEENILGVEPAWLQEKRRRDEQEGFSSGKISLTKQQLILAKKFVLELQEQQKSKLQEQQMSNSEANVVFDGGASLKKSVN